MEKIIDIDAATAKEWLDQGQAIMIDVREKEEYDAAHIDGVQFSPLSAFEAEQVPDLTDKKIIMQCRSGGRSHKAAVIAHDVNRDYPLYNLAGGILGWIEAGYPIKE